MGNLPDKEFKVLVMKMLEELRRMAKHNENFHKEIENIRKFQTEATLLRDTITEIKKKKKSDNKH